MSGGRITARRSTLPRKCLRWAIGLAVAAVVALGWPSESSRRADLFLRARPPITAQALAGIWITPTIDLTIRLYVRPAGADLYDIRSIIDSYGFAPHEAYTYATRARVVGFGDGPSALLSMDEPIAPFRLPPKYRQGEYGAYFDPSGYFVVDFDGPSFAEHRFSKYGSELMDRDRLRICPIPRQILARAIRSGRLKGMLVEQAGETRVVVTDSPKGVRSFLLAYADADESVYNDPRCRSLGFHGVRRLKWHRPIRDFGYGPW
jgi:hypothetical protein